MSRICDWMSKRSAPQLFLIYGTYFGLAFWAFGLISGYHLGIASASLAGVLFALLMSAFVVRARRRAGGIYSTTELNSAIESGELPSFFDRAAWPNQLELRFTSLRRSLIWTPITFGAFVLFALVGLFAATPSKVLMVIVAVFLAGIGAVSFVNTRRPIPKPLALQQNIQDAHVRP